MRRYVFGMIMAVFTCIAILPLYVSAGEDKKEDKKEDKAWINCVSEGGETVVNLHLPNATEKRIATFRLKLYVDDEPKVVFTDEAKRRARVCESRYNDETNILSIYVSASRSSVDYPVFDNDSLAVCRLTAEDREGDPVRTVAKLADLEDAFCIVRDKEKVSVALEDRTGTEEQDPDNDSSAYDQKQDGAGNQRGRSDDSKAVWSYIVIGAAGIAVVLVAAALVYRRRKSGRS